MNSVTAWTGFVAEFQGPAARLPQALNQFLQRGGGVGECARTATTIVSLCTSMPINRIAWSMTRLLCLRLHARPSSATLDHCTWRDGSPFRTISGSSRGREHRPKSNHRLGWFQGLRPWRVQGRDLALLPSLVPSVDASIGSTPGSPNNAILLASTHHASPISTTYARYPGAPVVISPEHCARSALANMVR